MKFFLIKHWKRLVGIALGLVVAYLILGTSLPFLRHPKPEPSDFDPQSVYSDTLSAQRVAAVTTSKDALLWRLRIIESAQDELILSTFEFADDNSGKDMMAALLAAADRGVSVRILVDGITSILHMPFSPYFDALAGHKNIELRRYAPLDLLRPWQIQTRMHDKYLMADGRCFLLGGRNIFDEFLGDYSPAASIDREILVFDPSPGSEGAATVQLADYFEEVWALDCNVQKPDKSTKKAQAAAAELAARYTDLKANFPEAFAPTDWQAATLPCAKITLLANPITPTDKPPVLWNNLAAVLATGQNILFQTPYIICDDSMYATFYRLTGEGRQISFVTNAVASGSNLWGCTDYLREKPNILATGCRVYEFSGDASSHSKAILMDGRISIVGSYNLDLRSTYLDTEVMLVIDSPELNAQLQAVADAELYQSREALENDEYIYAGGYVHRKLHPVKAVLYAVLRIVFPLIRHLT